MARTVQLTLTLEVDVDATFCGSGWLTKRVHQVRCEGNTLHSDALKEFLLARYNEELADAYAQQEP